MGIKEGRIDNGGGSHTSRWKHSENHAAIKRRRQMRNKIFGEVDKALSRRERKERSLQELEEEERVRIEDEQAFQHGLQHGIWDLFRVNIGLGDVYDLSNRERVIDHYTTLKGTNVMVTIVDFPRQQKNK